MPVGLSCWPSGLNPAVPFPTCSAGVMPAGQGNIVQQALELARRTQDNLRAGGSVQFVQQNVQLNIQDEHRHAVAEEQRQLKKWPNNSFMLNNKISNWSPADIRNSFKNGLAKLRTGST